MNNSLKLLAILFLYAALNLPFLTLYPPINNTGDESWFMNISYELMTMGSPIASIFPHTPLGEDVQTTILWIYNGMLSFFFSFLGPSIWTGRFLSFSFGCIVIITVYFFGRDIYSPRIGLLSSLLLSTSTVFSLHSREMRPEMMLIAFITASIYLFFIAWKNNKLKFFFISGFLSTISLQVHQNSIVFTVSLIVIFITLYKRDIFSKSALLLCAGLLTGFSAWIVFNYLPYSIDSFHTVHNKYIPPLLRINIFILIKQSFLNIIEIFSPSYLRWLAGKYDSHMLDKIIYFSMIIIFAGIFFGEKRAHLRFISSFIILPLILLSFVAGTWNWFHNSVFISLLSLALVIAVTDLSCLSRQTVLKKLLPVGIVIIISGFGIGEIIANNKKMMKYDFDAAMARVHDNVPEGSTVLGTSFYYPAFIKSNKRFIGHLFLEERCPDFKDEINSLKVDYILIDIHFNGITRVWCSDAYYENQISQYLQSNAVLLKTIKIHYPSFNIITDSVSLYKTNRPL
jgi:4-amino-4-deoxy-L-arabinose transferase-like glycosyltransferase